LALAYGQAGKTIGGAGWAGKNWGWDGKAMAKSRAAIPCGILVAIAKQFMQCLLAEHELQH